MGDEMGRISLAAMMLLASATVTTAQTLDGAWNLKFVSTSSNPICKDFGTMPMTIAGNRATGKLVHSTAGQYELNVPVGSDGSINNAVMAGRVPVTLSGKVADGAGSGSWTSLYCAGTWTAMR